jgi:hypothetical protein
MTRREFDRRLLDATADGPTSARAVVAGWRTTTLAQLRPAADAADVSA